MKTLKTLFLILIVMAINVNTIKASKISNIDNKVFSTTTKEEKSYSFKVDGSCDMCKSKIEKAAKEVKGVTSAKWDSKTHIITVKAKSEINIDDVHKAIAKIGYDTEKVKADDNVYNTLPKCCQYRK